MMYKDFYVVLWNEVISIAICTTSSQTGQRPESRASLFSMNIHVPIATTHTNYQLHPPKSPIVS